MIFKVTWTIEDWKGRDSRLMAFVDLLDDTPGVFNFLDVELWAKTQAQSLDLIIKGKIRHIGINYEPSLPAGIKTIAHVNADVEEGALVFYRAYDTADEIFRHRIPTATEDYVDQDRVWHWEEAPVGPSGGTFFDLLTSNIADIGAWAAVIDPVNARGEQIGFVSRAEEKFKK